MSQESAEDSIVATIDEKLNKFKKNRRDSNLLRSNESEQIKKVQVIIGVKDDGKPGPNTSRNFQLWKSAREAEIQQKISREKRSTKGHRG